MSVLFVALPVALLLGAAALVACVRCIRGGQFDDLETPAVRMLIDDTPDRRPRPAAPALDDRPTNPDDVRDAHASARQRPRQTQPITGRDA